MSGMSRYASHLGGFNNLDFSVRAEIILYNKDFTKINSTLPETDKYKTPRAAAAGIARQVCGDWCECYSECRCFFLKQ